MFGNLRSDLRVVPIRDADIACFIALLDGIRLRSKDHVENLPLGSSIASQFAKNHSSGNDHDSIAVIRHFLKLRRYKDDRHAGACEVLECSEQFGLGSDINSARRPIDQEHFPSGTEPFCKDELLLISSRQIL